MKDLFVSKSNNDKALILKEKVSNGEVILVIEGKETTSPTKYSIQINKNKHLDISTHPDINNKNHYWVFLNHSCNPNTFIKDRKLIALKNINQNTELTYNYNTTEYEMSTPFLCRCNHEDCIKEVKGFKFLSAKQKQFIQEQTAPYLFSY